MSLHPTRSIEVLVLSDIHLGTYGCHARELLHYLHSIEPQQIILNGDIIDAWQFSKKYWPAAHMAVIQYFLDAMVKGVPLVYIPGNHDEVFRKFKGVKVGSLSIDNKLVLDLNGQKTWIFHGDVFDVVMQHSRWLSRLGAVGYDLLILINKFVNYCSEKMGRGKISLSKKVKNSVKSAVKFINGFENTICEIAAEQGFHTVICGHIHEPALKDISVKNGSIRYLNSGDWIENLTALEYNQGSWELYRYADMDEEQVQEIIYPKKRKSTQEVLDTMLLELKLEQVPV